MPGFHFSSWRMLAWTSPSATGVPARVSGASAMRRPPQIDTASSTVTAATAARTCVRGVPVIASVTRTLWTTR